MKFNVNKDSFIKGLQMVQSIISSHNTVAVLYNVLISAAEGKLNTARVQVSEAGAALGAYAGTDPAEGGALAAAILAKGWGVPVQGVIGAVPGHDSAQSAQVLEKYGPRIRPDWVVIGNLWSDLYAGTGASRVREIRADWAKGPLRRTATYRVLVRFLTPWLRTRAVSFVTSAADIGAPGGADARVDLRTYAQNLTRMADQAARLGARPIFLVLPAPADADPAPMPETILQYREAMRVVARRTDAALVDGPALFQEKKVDIVYFADQVHPNSLGHQLLGEAVAEVIEEQGRPDPAR